MLTTIQAMAPEDVALGYWTHINFAFAYIDPGTFEIAPMSNDVCFSIKIRCLLSSHFSGRGVISTCLSP